MEADRRVDLRYRHDERAQFLLFVEQFDEAVRLARSAEPSRLRMALVAADNLAEMLLFRQMRRAERVGAESWSHDVPRLGGNALKKFRKDFKARVRFAQKGSSDPLLERAYRPMLSRGQAAIFRVAHTYRNRVYHADHHNPTVLPLIVRAYLRAIGEGFVRLQPTGYGIAIDPELEGLKEYGFTGWAFEREDVFSPGAAAREIVTHLTRGLEVKLGESKETLAEDLLWRTKWADAMVDGLERDGPMSRDEIEESLRWSEFGEEEVDRDGRNAKLANETARLWVAARGASEEAALELMKRSGEAAEERASLFFDRLRKFERTVRLERIDGTRRAVARLRSASSSEALFTAYHQLDKDLEVLERYLDDLAIGLDRRFREEEEVARGN